MSTATELLRLSTPEETNEAIRKTIEYDLTKDEARQVVQIRFRAGLPVAECVERALSTRPRIERKELIIGKVLDTRAVRLIADRGPATVSRLLQRKLAARFPDVICQRVSAAAGRFTLLLKEEEASRLRGALAGSSLEQAVTDLLLDLEP
jgi:hypothetical protein